MTLAARLGLPYSGDMQDWEWEVADTARFEEFIEAYRAPDLSEDERFSLMEILVQCAEDAANTSRFEVLWSRLAPLLKTNFELHRPTVEYWSQSKCDEFESKFDVSQPLHLLRLEVLSQVPSRPPSDA